MTNARTAENGVDVRLFGGPRVAFHDEPIRLSPRQAALVCLVFGHPDRALTRSRAIWLLWERDPGSKERHALRQLLHVTQGRIGERIIETPGDRLCGIADMELDVTAFNALLDQGRIKDAAGLAAGGFGAALPSTIGRELEDWIYGRRIKLEQRVIEAAVQVWHDRDDLGWDSAADAAEALYRLRPQDPGHVLMVIEARARAGRLAAAEAAYAAHMVSVGQESHPDEELEALMDRVRSLDHSGLVPSERRPRVVPLIGRDAQLRSANKLLQGREPDRCDVLVVRGEAGIGKSRLLDEVRKEAALRGYTCLTARPVELERNIALNPIIDALSSVDVRPHLDALGEPWKAIIASVLPASATDGPPGEVPPIQESSLSRRLLDAFWMLFDHLASDAPLFLVVDDIQWADPSSIALLQFLERRWDRGRLVLAYAFRPDCLERGGALEKYLTREGEGSGFEIDLHELDDPDAVELLRSAVGAPMDERVEHYLGSLAANHPFYIIELARDHASGRLEPPPRHDDAIPIPVSLQQLFDARLGHLSDGALRVASILAARAKPMRMVDISTLVDIELEDCADRLEELQRHHFVDVERDRATVSHELFRTALYRHLGEARRAVLHLRIAQHLEASGSQELSGELAVHYARAGDNTKAVRFAKEAAAEARKNGALASAAKYFEIVAENTDDDHERAIATGDLATTLHLDRQIHRAGPMLELAATRLREADEAALARRMEIRRIESLAELGALPVDGLLEGVGALLTHARESRDPEAIALTLDTELHLRHRASDFAGIRRVLLDLARLKTEVSDEAECICCIGLAMEAVFGDPRRGSDFADLAVSLSNSLSPEFQLIARVRRLAVDLYQGRGYLSESLATLDEARALAAKSGNIAQRYYLEANNGVLHLEAGELDQAEAALEVARELLGGRDLSLSRLRDSCNRGELYLARGEYGAAHRYFLEAERQSRGNTPRFLAAIAVGGLGLCALSMGDLGEARRRERELAMDMPDFVIDQSIAVVFLARMLVTRNQGTDAANLLSRFRAQAKGRLVFAWLRLTEELARTNVRMGALTSALKTAREGFELAKQLRLSTRAKQFSHLIDRIDPHAR